MFLLIFKRLALKPILLKLYKVFKECHCTYLPHHSRYVARFVALSFWPLFTARNKSCYHTGGYFQKWDSEEQKNESNMCYQGLFWGASNEIWTERVSFQVSTENSQGLLEQLSRHIALDVRVKEPQREFTVKNLFLYNECFI